MPRLCAKLHRARYGPEPSAWVRKDVAIAKEALLTNGSVYELVLEKLAHPGPA